MMHKVLVIQGAGEGAHDEDKALADYVKTALGSRYTLTYPEFHGLENVAYEPWREQIGAELERLGDDGIIVAHSLGGSALLKYLSEEQAVHRIAGLFLVAPPYKGRDGEWATDDFAMDADAASGLAAAIPMFIYHSEDDEWVPFSHLSQWAAKLPGIVSREFDDRGHSFTGKAFVELIADIKALHGPG